MSGASECRGCSYDKYKSVVEGRLDGPVFKGRDGSVTAQLEPEWVVNRCVRTTVCPYLLASGSRCAACTYFDGTLRKALSRLANPSESNQMYTAHSLLTREELISS